MRIMSGVVLTLASGAVTPPMVVMEMLLGEMSKRISLAWLLLRVFLMFTSLRSELFMLMLLPPGVPIDEGFGQLLPAPWVSI